MAAVEFDADDLDDNSMIENAIRQTLSQHISAEVAADLITRLYRLPSDDETTYRTLQEKCDAIAKIFDVETFMSGNLAVFLKPANQ